MIVKCFITSPITQKELGVCLNDIWPTDFCHNATFINQHFFIFHKVLSGFVLDKNFRFYKNSTKIKELKNTKFFVSMPSWCKINWTFLLILNECSILPMGLAFRFWNFWPFSRVIFVLHRDKNLLVRCHLDKHQALSEWLDLL